MSPARKIIAAVLGDDHNDAVSHPAGHQIAKQRANADRVDAVQFFARLVGDLWRGAPTLGTLPTIRDASCGRERIARWGNLWFAP
jgi:hypothetical protein